MQIQLKQSEIEAGLKLYIEQQGISLQDKSVEIRFTAGRRGSGLTADVDIQVTAGSVDAVVPKADTTATAAPAEEEPPFDTEDDVFASDNKNSIFG